MKHKEQQLGQISFSLFVKLGIKKRFFIHLVPKFAVKGIFAQKTPDLKSEQRDGEGDKHAAAEPVQVAVRLRAIEHKLLHGTRK